MTTEIIVKLQIEGYHQWQECNIDEVSFLKNQHRHIFYLDVRKKVTHFDRDIEIILFKRNILEYFGKQPIDFGNKSCEMIAEDIFKKFNCSSVKVLEDNENGAIITE